MSESHARRDLNWLTPVGAWLAVVWLIGDLQRAAASHWGTGPAWTPGSLLPFDLLAGTGRIRFDGYRYLEIARTGYPSGQGYEAVFPGYPLLIRLLHGVGGGYSQAAVGITLASGLASACLFWHWMGRKGLALAERRLALALFLLFPYGFVRYGVPYSDALLVALVLGAVVLVEHDRPVLAGLVGALATFTRPNALPLIPALVVMVLESRGALTFPTVRPLRGMRFHRGLLRFRDAGVLLAFGGLLAYSAWVRDRSGDPLYFWHVQREWGHRPFTDPFNWLKANLIRNENVFVEPLDGVNELLSFGIIAWAVAALTRLGRRFGWGYAVLTLGMVVTTWVTAVVFAPSGRYLLPAVPFLIALAAPWMVRHRLWTIVAVVASVVWLVVLTAAFAGDGVSWINQAAW